MSNKRALKIINDHISVAPDGTGTLYLNPEWTKKLVGLLTGAPRPSKPAVPRPRNPLFDAMVKAMGVKLEELGPRAGSRIAAALAEITVASPDVTPDEILRRAARYRDLWPTATFSANALALNWAHFSTGIQRPDFRREVPAG